MRLFVYALFIGLAVSVAAGEIHEVCMCGQNTGGFGIRPPALSNRARFLDFVT